ncbi:MAG TPA: porin [Burkholderiaceae bacterium]|nr:porin [Burkholderiaceae bacterium]
MLKSARLSPRPIAQAVGLLALWCVSGAAMAQSSVTLGGVMDGGLRIVKNSGLPIERTEMSGSNMTSRFYLRGTEDLGGGLSAGFHVETGLQLPTGSTASSVAGQFWDRRSTVSLASSSLGELRLGRDYAPSYTSWSMFDPFGYVGIAGSNNLISSSPQGPIRAAFGSNPNTTVRSNSGFQWFSPGGWGGVNANLFVTANEGGTAAAGIHKVTGLRVGWSGSGVRLSAASTRTSNDLTTLGSFTDNTVGASYDFSGVRISAAWRRFQYANARQTNLMLAGTIKVGQSGNVKISLGKNSFNGNVGATNISSNSARLVGLGYVHDLSRRTALYAHVARLSNRGALSMAIAGGYPGLAAGGSSTGYEFGLRHIY